MQPFSTLRSRSLPVNVLQLVRFVHLPSIVCGIGSYAAPETNNSRMPGMTLTGVHTEYSAMMVAVPFEVL